MSTRREQARWYPREYVLTYSGSVTSIFLEQRDREAAREEEEERRRRGPMGFGPQRPRRRP